ncbi:MAG: ATPase [Roseiarcus sp.]|jgi:F-type H+-transporting ATPase subunit b
MTIDWWTLAIQTVNVVILIWLLERFFWRPVAAMIEQRRATAQRTLTEAEAQRGAATAALADIARTRAGFAGEREAILAAAHEAAQKAGAASRDEAAKEVASLQAAAQAAIEAGRQAAETAWTERASRLAVDIAGRLAARLDGPAVRGAFLGWLVEAIRALPGPAREAIAADGIVLEAVSATPLDPAEQPRCRDAIAAAVGGDPQIAFTADPALIAGLELHGPHLVVANSWRADLTRILSELTHDGKA